MAKRARTIEEVRRPQRRPRDGRFLPPGSLALPPVCACSVSRYAVLCCAVLCRARPPALSISSHRLAVGCPMVEAGGEGTVDYFSNGAGGLKKARRAGRVSQGIDGALALRLASSG